MAPIQGAVVTFTSTRSCFISVPEKWIKRNLAFQDIPVFKIEYSDDRKAYFSSKGGDPSSFRLQNEVLLNGKYAGCLGLQEKEQVFVQQIENSIPQAEKVHLEPLNSDDWEIMQLNTETVETGLLNQVRVVWKGQVFPIWVHQSSFFVRVAQLEPDVEPALLVEWTEIHVAPKERNLAQSQLDSLVQKKKDMCMQYMHLRKSRKSLKSSKSYDSSSASDEVDTKPGSISLPNMLQSPQKKPVFSLFRYVMQTVFQNDPNCSSSVSNELFSNFIPLNLTFRLRVISCSKVTSDGLPLALQATTVFISEKTFSILSTMHPIPVCFVAKLSKLLSPADRKEQEQALLSRETKDKSKKRRDDKSSVPVEKTPIVDTIFVNVIVLKSFKEEFEVPVALFLNANVIAVPLEIKRRLGLEVSSCVRCQSVENKPIIVNHIFLQPLESLHRNFGEDLAKVSFNKWIEDANLEDSSLVLGDGTLVKLNVSPARTCDFIIFLSQPDNGDSSFSSPSSLSNTSTSSTDSEKAFSAFPPVRNYGFINRTILQRLQIRLNSFSRQCSKLIWCHSSSSNKIEVLYQRIPALCLEALGGVKELAAKAMIDFELWFHLSPLTFEADDYCYDNGCMLIHGPKGVGKTTLIMALCKKLISSPYFIFVSTVECLPLRGKRVETIARKWDAVLSEAAHRQPSLILFEDLDQLAGSPATPEQEAGPDAIYFSTIAQTFITLIENIVDSKAGIVVVATSKSIHSLYPSLTNARGRHVFQSILEIKAPNPEYRVDMLQSLVLSKLRISADSLQSTDWQALATRTEGYVAQDLDSLVDRATHSAFVRTNFTTQNVEGNEQVSLIQEDFEEALEKYTPAALRGLQLEQGSTKTWSDVGGLEHVREVIDQILNWPIKYKELFKDFNLRPQTNILLYGAPGTGKTLIAGVVANESGLNFISIKGPELLSKYIGASEQAVRDLFARATSAKPCVLFFDEFDALAPRRGHDSTGVTDRVVNQLLTQIDGVENLEGVYIMAATSRPELIDPALLRPGRFDRCLHCPLPDHNGRLKILHALSSNLVLSDEVDLEAIAQMTDNYSGADLQALLYSGQIEALHESQANRSRRCSLGGEEMDDAAPTSDTFIYIPSIEKGAIDPSPEMTNEIMSEINMIFSNLAMKNDVSMSQPRHRKHSTISLFVEQRHLLKVLANMHPSVSAQERLRYERIFQKFKGTRGSSFSTPEKSAGKRVTLA